MQKLSVQVVVVGGGATGTGILRDLAMRGISALLVEQGDLAHGTSSRFHGLLHSGCRYAVKDPAAARECIEENMILRRIAPNCVEITGGLFVQLPEDDPAYAEEWESACRQAGIEVEEVDPAAVRRQNPALSPRITRAFAVPDCAVDGFRVVWSNLHSARRYGARALTYTRLKAIEQQNGCITGVRAENVLTGEQYHIECQVLINAAGPWAGEVAALAGLEVGVIKDKGTLIAFNHRLVQQVVNRLRPPGDGDIFVPHGPITILGTTSLPVENPADNRPQQKEVLDLLAIGREIIPDLDEYRLIRTFAGVRPLYQEVPLAGSGRSVSRNYALLDHQQRDGLAGLISIVGGKFTTFRLMAEKATDLAAGKLGINRPCRTALEPLMSPLPPEWLERGRKVFGAAAAHKAAERLGDDFATVVARAEQNPEQARILCECELVSQAEVEQALAADTTFTLGDVRRKTRLGMGTCQGTFCSYRSLGMLGRYPRFAADHRQYLADFLQKRWKGMRPVLWGQQLREAQLSTAIYSALFGMERML